jgi:hypothetical protein
MKGGTQQSNNFRGTMQMVSSKKLLIMMQKSMLLKLTMKQMEIEELLYLRNEGSWEYEISGEYRDRLRTELHILEIEIGKLEEEIWQLENGNKKSGYRLLKEIIE